MIFKEWLFNASEDEIEGDFILSDLVDIPLTESELCETAYFDSLATQTAGNHRDDDSNIPLGKRVY